MSLLAAWTLVLVAKPIQDAPLGLNVKVGQEFAAEVREHYVRSKGRVDILFVHKIVHKVDSVDETGKVNLTVTESQTKMVVDGTEAPVPQDEPNISHEVRDRSGRILERNLPADDAQHFYRITRLLTVALPIESLRSGLEWVEEGRESGEVGLASSRTRFTVERIEEKLVRLKATFSGQTNEGDLNGKGNAVVDKETGWPAFIYYDLSGMNPPNSELSGWDLSISYKLQKPQG